MTSAVTVVWSAVAASCLTVAAVHALIGLRQGRRANVLFAVNALSIATVAAFELALMRATTTSDYGSILRWMHVALFALVASFVLFVRAFFRAGKPWLAGMAVASRGFALIVNFLHPPNLNFVEITGLRRVPILGEDVSVAIGQVSRWTRLGELASLLLLLFLLDAAITVWKRGERQRAAVVGGSMVLFVLGAAGPTAFVHWGMAAIPYTISIAYLGIVAAMGYELTSDVLRASALSRELASTESALQETDRRLALAADAASLGFWSWDVPRDEIWMTPRGRVLRGLAPDERLDSARFFSTIHREDRSGVREALEPAAARGGEFDHEYRIVRPDGEVRWIALHGAGGADRAGRGCGEPRST